MLQHCSNSGSIGEGSTCKHASAVFDFEQTKKHLQHTAMNVSNAAACLPGKKLFCVKASSLRASVHPKKKMFRANLNLEIASIMCENDVFMRGFLQITKVEDEK